VDVIDSQVHVWDRDSSEFPWDHERDTSVRSGGAHADTNPITIERMVGMMDAVGVRGAFLASPGIYGTDLRYAWAAAERFPGRFGIIGPLKPETPDIEGRIAELREHSAGIGIRVVVSPDSDLLEREDTHAIFAAAQRAGVPAFVWVMVHRLQSLQDIARKFPELVLVVDHLGMRGPPDPADRLAYIPDLVTLAQFENVAVKCSGAPSLSKQPYPFLDLWPHLHQVFDAFGIRRVMWGSDITQHMEKHTYAQGVDYMRLTDELSDDEKRLVMGENAKRIVGWPKDDAEGEHRA
jgi:predicted TIM-barrel fold metal-dependent hydrolase